MFRNNHKLMIKIVFEVAVAFIVVVFMFIHLEKLIDGKIIWGEVCLAGCFLVGVGILITVAKELVCQVVIKMTQNIKSTLLQRSVRLVFQGSFWVFIILPFLLTAFTIHRPKIGDRLTPESALGLSYEKVLLKTKDHLVLDGWFIPAKSDSAVIIGHGLGANKSNFLITAEFWHRLGFNVLIFDFRGHGYSEGHTISFGYKERQDIEAGLDYLMARRDIDHQKIFGYGVSFGGAAMIQAAAEDPRLKAIIIDSAYADIDSMAIKTVERVGFVPRFLVKMIADIGLSMASLENGFDVRQYSPQRAIEKVKQPVLLIHGKKDTLIPWQETEKLFAGAHEPKVLRYFETEGHYTTMNDGDYKKVIQDFLDSFKRAGIKL